jgi:hypothetical protein
MTPDEKLQNAAEEGQKFAQLGSQLHHYGALRACNYLDF